MFIKAFLEQTKKNPSNMAVCDIRGGYSYKTLNERSSHIAKVLLESIPEDAKHRRVAVYLSRSRDYIASLIAILRAGCCIVPIDGEYPIERAATTIDSSECSVVLTDNNSALDISGTKIISMDTLFDDEDFSFNGELDLSGPDLEGMILFTSGSTGKPKGVIHRQEVFDFPVNIVKEVAGVDESLHTMCIAGFNFIASLLDITPPLSCGGSVYIANEVERKNFDMLHALIDKRGITGMFISPQMYGVMTRIYGELNLDYVLLAGEKVEPSYLTGKNEWELYGSTEVPGVLMHRAGDGMPGSLGGSCDRTNAFLYDDEGNAIADTDIIGELRVSGSYVALGYCGLEEETKKRFLRDPENKEHALFCTGDYMAYGEDGSFIFHGRKDRMVKIRGYRVELGEVEQVLRNYDGMEEIACVDARVNGNDNICCYYTGAEASPEAVKNYAGKTLPEYMIPEFIVHLDEMPRNERNKIDYPALKNREIITAEAEYEPPCTELEEIICDAFASVLEVDRVSVLADFFEFGGTSLSAALLISKLGEKGYAPSFQDILANPTPRDLGTFLDSHRSAYRPSMDREYYPLTKTQLGIYLESLTGGSKETYSSSYLARAAEGVEAGALINAVRRVIEAHPCVKYIIKNDKDGMPHMVLAPDAQIDIPVIEGRDEDRLDFMKNFIPVVPMMNELLFHFAVYRTESRCYLAIKSHLIFFDGTAISLFIAEMNRVLSGGEPIGEDFSIQQVGMYEERLLADGSHDKARQYYLDLFKDFEDVPALMGDLNGQLTPGVSENLRFEPGDLKASEVKAFCDRLHISESSFFQGAMAILLGKYLNSKYVSFSTVYNGRGLSEMNNTMGTLIKRIPVCGDLSKDIPVDEFLKKISKQLFSSMSNDIYSFDEVLKNCPVNEDVEFIYQGDLFTDKMGTAAGKSLLEGDKWFMEHYHTGMVTGCMSIQFFSTDGLYNMTLEYRNERFSADYVRRFAKDLFAVARGLMKAHSIGEISILSDEDKGKLASFNDTAVDIGFKPVHIQIHEHAVNKPDKIAVIADGKKLSFRELDLITNRLSQILRKEKVQADSLVGVLFDRQIWAYVAEIAILKAGGAFVPFITDYPDDRILFCMDDADSNTLLTTKAAVKDRDLDNKGFKLLTLEALLGSELEEIACDDSYDNVELADSDKTDLAYCIYTSGSTGRPKGVMIEHQNIANYVHRNEKSLEIMYYAEPERVNLAIAAFSFDVSVVEEFVPLCNGNTVVIATETEIHNPGDFAKLVRETGANGITCTPTYLLSLLEIPESREAIGQFTFFDIGAEAFPIQLYSKLRELRDDSVILNVYGPTECTMGCAAVVMDGSEVVTVGPPIANTYFYVSDTFGNELPVGMKGELIICGDQVGRGYVKLPDKTAAAFFTHDGMRAYHSGDLAAWTEDGEVRIFGRLDNQIKLRGFRIELDEIEKVMSEYPGVATGAAVVKKNGSLEYLAGYYTASASVSEAELKKHMMDKLPEYMVPSVIIQLDKMPQTSNGKVDRKALPNPDIQEMKAEYVAPNTPEEKALCAAFAKALSLENGSVGILDDFFDLGGDSLKAMVALAESHLDGLTAADIFQLRTPSNIARELENRSAMENLDDRDTRARGESHMLTPMQVEMVDLQLFSPDSTMWSNTHFLVRFDERIDADRLCDAVNRAIDNHPGLSVKFYFDENSELRQKYEPGLVPKVVVKDIMPSTEESLSQVLVLPFRKILDSCLCKVNVFKGQKGTYLFMDVHHLLMDGGSLGVILGDIVNAYFGRELKRDYYFALIEQEEERIKSGKYEEDRKYYTERYGQDKWCRSLDTDEGTRDISLENRMKRLSFDADKVQAAEKRSGVTISVMAIAAALKALSKATGKNNVMTNWIFNNRLSPESESSVGMLIKNLPVAVRMDEIESDRELLLTVKEQVASGIAHNSYDYLASDLQPFKNEWMEVNLQLGINGSELDELDPELIELEDEFSVAAGCLELELLENEYGDGGYDSEMEYAGKMHDRAVMERFHDLYVEILENMVNG
ncbi:non-ribosomal peptide synthetase [Butyrivibrio sp. AE3006]|uniref:non-ribosomal peptide synthetase n=1 Tax=Butyrivibrio sp. AE3006 TaxID=1280673 RepID=UPI000422F2FE|nr:non-ribosomal peptide synthetase [Butyrivibrio sp. AE3006]